VGRGFNFGSRSYRLTIVFATDLNEYFIQELILVLELPGKALHNTLNN